MHKKILLRYAAVLAMSLALLIVIVPSQAKGASNPMPKNEMRAAWIATVTNIDMKKGMDQSQFTSWAQTTLDKLKAQKFNAVIFQVKPTNDALYPSKLAPWSSYITGQAQGTNPGYDPLLIMTQEAHKRGMELHAWVNPYRVTMPGQALTSLAATNVARTHPEWVVKYGSQYYLNPGLPEVQDYLVSTVKELVANYDIDAVHMDDYFYPYKIAGQIFPDQATFKKYGGSFTKIDDWRRDNVNRLVRQLYTSIKSTKNHVQFGISPFGVWRNNSLDPTGSNTKAGVNNYDDLFADTRQWIKDGSIDYIAPQIYWSRSLAAANYSILLDWWSKEIATYANVHPVNLYIGMADYKVGNDSDKAWNDKMELPNQVAANRANANVAGQMHFSLRSIQGNALGYVNLLTSQLYNYTAVTPAVTWKNNAQPAKPSSVQAVQESGGMKLTINGPSSSEARKYIIYRFEGLNQGSYLDPRNIVDVVYNNGTTTYLDKAAKADKTYTYGITSVSPTGVENKDAYVLADGQPPEKVITLFKDISSLHRAYKEIAYLTKGNIIYGDEKGYFNPSQQVTRADAAAMIGRTLNLDGAKRKTSFKDVGANMVASGYIQSAVENHILSGYSNGTFKPYDKITRGEMALMISRAFGYDYGNSASGAAHALLSRGIAQGTADGTFGSDLKIIRADYAIFLARSIDYTLRINSPAISYSGEMAATAALPIRTGPSEKYGQTGTVAQNEKVSIGYQVGTWTFIKTASGKTGFVLAASLKS
ncbi:family 10 glycosylhydrolase [Bacillus testis]|uniref:family 10 glycosylhydrolase n=1 Tax=Bacillus testis TaxID=1622072 RepID=UPI00067F54D1|nr:family 10 glycosylhydrolase [Bacillus testis]